MSILGQVFEMDDDMDESEDESEFDDDGTGGAAGGVGGGGKELFSKGIVMNFFEQAETTFEEMKEAL